MRTFGLTHQGLIRANNEDRFVVRELAADSVLLAVADGLGGQAGGETAACILTDAVAGFIPRARRRPSADDLRILLLKASQMIQNEAASNFALSGMGTTATIAWVDHGMVYWCHVGDSRLYHLRGLELLQVTADHNMAGMMVEQGEFSPEQAAASPLRNVLVRCAGCNTCRPDTGVFNLGESDLLLLCTDGLNSVVPHRTITELLTGSASAQEKASALVEAALAAGGPDNVTVIVAGM